MAFSYIYALRSSLITGSFNFGGAANLSLATQFQVDDAGVVRSFPVHDVVGAGGGFTTPYPYPQSDLIGVTIYDHSGKFTVLGDYPDTRPPEHDLGFGVPTSSLDVLLRLLAGKQGVVNPPAFEKNTDHYNVSGLLFPDDTQGSATNSFSSVQSAYAGQPITYVTGMKLSKIKLEYLSAVDAFSPSGITYSGTYQAAYYMLFLELFKTTRRINVSGTWNGRSYYGFTDTRVSSLSSTSGFSHVVYTHTTDITYGGHHYVIQWKITRSLEFKASINRQPVSTLVSFNYVPYTCKQVFTYEMISTMVDGSPGSVYPVFTKTHAITQCVFVPTKVHEPSGKTPSKTLSAEILKDTVLGGYTWSGKQGRYVDGLFKHASDWVGTHREILNSAASLAFAKSTAEIINTEGGANIIESLSEIDKLQEALLIPEAVDIITGQKTLPPVARRLGYNLKQWRALKDDLPQLRRVLNGALELDALDALTRRKKATVMSLAQNSAGRYLKTVFATIPGWDSLSQLGEVSARLDKVGKAFHGVSYGTFSHIIDVSAESPVFESVRIIARAKNVYDAGAGSIQASLVPIQGSGSSPFSFLTWWALGKTTWLYDLVLPVIRDRLQEYQTRAEQYIVGTIYCILTVDVSFTVKKSYLQRYGIVPGEFGDTSSSFRIKYFGRRFWPGVPEAPSVDLTQDNTDANISSTVIAYSLLQI